ncbi:MAG: leucine-rich repeat domain-containing protein [Treponema sp.]|nr:leucine-rich repeat domain-containing protein [Treponema sp.]
MKKRSIISAIVLFVFLIGVPVILSAQSRSIPNSPDDFRIANSSLGGVRITRYIGTRQDVVIPETIDGLSVTEISASAFALDTRTDLGYPSEIDVIINSVVLPNTLIEIGSYAFSGQPLTSISFPSSLRTIQWFAFYNNNFTSVIIPNGVTYIGTHAFGTSRGKSKITSVTIPPSLANYGSNIGFWNAFKEFDYGWGEGTATSINSITLPANVSSRNLHLFGISQFHNGFHNAYEGNERRAGTYIWTGRIWVVQ